MLGVTVFIVSTLVFNTHGQNNKEYGNNIKWTIKRYPIVFGKDAILFCNLSSTDNCCANRVTWMKESDVILHYGASTNSSKYQQIKEKGGFSLVIKHFDEKDINCQYVCLYGFDRYSGILRINSNDFELRPTNETTKYTINATQLVVDVNFGKVFPSPQCQIVMNDRILQSKIVENETTNGLFLSSHIKLVCELQSVNCSGNISVQCLVGKTHVVKTTILSGCKNLDATFTTIDNTIKEVVLGVTVFLALFFLIAVPVIIHWKKLHLRLYCSADLEGDEMHSFLHLQKGSECLLQIISECFHYRYWVPSQRSKDVIKWLQVVLCDRLYLQLLATNFRINQIRNQMWMVIVEYASDMCSYIGIKILYSRKSRVIQVIMKHTVSTDDKYMLSTGRNIKINEARMHKKENELDSLIDSMYNRTSSAVLQKMTENRMDIVDNDVKEKSNEDINGIRIQLHLKKKRANLLQLINFARTGDVKNMLVNASNSRINHARDLFWKERNQLDSLINSMDNRTSSAVLQKMTENRMDIADNVKEKSNGDINGIRMQLHLKKKRDNLLQLMNFTPIGDVKNMLVNASNCRINHARDLLWKERNHGDINGIRIQLHLKKKRANLLQLINFARTGDVKNMLVNASNSRINHARDLFWKERNQLDSLINSMDNRTSPAVLQKMTENRMDIADNVKEKSNGDINGIRMQLHLKKKRDNLLQLMNFTPIGDVKNMLVNASNCRINHARDLLWKERNRLDTEYRDVQVGVSVKQSPSGNDDPPISRFNRITHDRDIIVEIETFKKTNSGYCFLMAFNIRINEARLKKSKTEKRMKYQ